MVSAKHATPPAAVTWLADRYQHVRALSMALAQPLHPEDQVVQTIPEVSPTKWHLAHTTWFFDHFVLAALTDDYRPYNERYHHLFNSYYYTVGDMFSRPQRGLLSRPTVAEIASYRTHVDQAVLGLLLLRPDDNELKSRVELGLHHEQQHQELLLTDIKHVLAVNPMGPAYREDLPIPDAGVGQPLEFQARPGGLHRIGAAAD